MIEIQYQINFFCFNLASLFYSLLMEVGTRVSLKGIKGTVLYIGPFHDGEGTYVGVELDIPKGRNNGMVKGVKYFTCRENHGLFLKKEDLLSRFKILSEGEGTEKALLKESQSSPSVAETPTSARTGKADIKPSVSSQISPKNTNTNTTLPSKNQSPAANTTSISPKSTTTISPKNTTVSPKTQQQTGTKITPTTTISPKSQQKNTQQTTGTKITPSTTLSPKTQQQQTGTKITQNTQGNKLKAAAQTDAAKTQVYSTSKPLPQPNLQPKQPQQTTLKVQSPTQQSSLKQSSKLGDNKDSPASKSNIEKAPVKVSIVHSPSTGMNKKPEPQKTGTKLSPSQKTIQQSKSTTFLDNNAHPKPTIREPSPSIQAKAPQSAPKVAPTIFNSHIQPIKAQQGATQNTSIKKQPNESPKSQPVAAQNSQGNEPNTQKQAEPSSQPPNDEKKPLIPALALPTNIVPQPSSPSVIDDIPMGNSKLIRSISTSDINVQPAHPETELPKSSRVTASHLLESEETNIEDTIAIINNDVEKNLIPQELLKQVSDAKAKLDTYYKQHELIKKKLLDIANTYKKNKKLYIEKEELANTEFNNKLLEAQVSYEEDLNNLETQIYESAERTRKYLEIADEQRANKVISLLKMINDEHSRYEQDLELFINAQRINVNAATQSVQTLTDRLNRIIIHRQDNEKNITKKKEILSIREKELAEKRPRWKEVTQLRADFSEITEKIKKTKKQSLFKDAERDGIKSFYQLMTEVPLLDSLYLVLCIEQKTNNDEILHVCKLGKLVLSGFVSNFSKGQEVYRALTELNESIENKTEMPPLFGIIASFEAVSSIPLDSALTPNFLRYESTKINDEEIKNQTLQLADEIKSEILHQVLLPDDKKEEYLNIVRGLKDELKRAQISDEEEVADVKQYIGKLQQFEVAHNDVINDFLLSQLPRKDEADKISPEVAKKIQERKELELKEKQIEEEIQKEKLKFESLRNELAEPMKIYGELVDELEVLKKQLNNYQKQ